ncbi:MAG: diguanylate cyclase [Sideroxydans sp.]|nr:diguanylate cyclase [Sideroxydans sp.]
MPVLLHKSRLLSLLAAILIAGFLTTTIASYLVSKNSLIRGVTEQSLPLTSDTIYSEIQRDLVRPIFISSTMAHDTFLREWVLRGEKDPRNIVRYLREIKDKYSTVTAFFVSEHTGRYYYAGGILKKINPHEPRDTWYYRVRKMQEPYETNVDVDMANRDTLTVFINYRVLDFKGNYIGATGVGLTMNTIGRTIDNYQARFKRRVYFVDGRGEIKLAGSSMPTSSRSIRAMSGISGIADKILNNRQQASRLHYANDNGNVWVNSRYLPELGLFLIVEQDENQILQPMVHIFWVNLAISTLVTLLVLLLAFYALNRYQKHLEALATFDQLTQLYNRQTFEVLFERAQLELGRSKQPLSVLLLDVDYFKRVNDTYGHLAGDRILRNLADKLRELLRDSDVIARWGGEEFVVLLRDCDLTQALVVANNLRKAIAEHDFSLPQQVTVSIGASQYAESDDLTSFFARVDTALYVAKQGGRDQIAAR